MTGGHLRLEWRVPVWYARRLLSVLDAEFVLDRVELQDVKTNPFATHRNTLQLEDGPVDEIWKPNLIVEIPDGL